MTERWIVLPAEDEKLAHATTILYKYMAVAPERADAPLDLSAFIAFQKVSAELEHDFKAQSVLMELTTEVEALGHTVFSLIHTTKAELRLTQAVLAQNDGREVLIAMTHPGLFLL
jgi:hypothetical protein